MKFYPSNFIQKSKLILSLLFIVLITFSCEEDDDCEETNWVNNRQIRPLTTQPVRYRSPSDMIMRKVTSEGVGKITAYRKFKFKSCKARVK